MAVSLNVRSASNWILLFGSGVLPPLMLLRMWHPPAQAMSESIREVLKMIGDTSILLRPDSSGITANTTTGVAGL